MAGLLDFLSTDEGRMGLGLLAAAGPRSDGMGVGGRIQLAMQGMDARKQEALKSKLLEMQMKNYESEIDSRKLAGVKDARQQAFIEEYYKNGGQGGGGGSGTSPGAFSPSIDGMGPTMPREAAPAQNQRGQIASKTIDQIQEFKDRTGIDHMPAWKLANEGFERKPGTFVEMPGQSPRYIEDPTKGLSFKNGVIGQMPGAETIARLAGQTSLMTELPKAMLAAGGRVNLRDNGDGTKSPIDEFSENPAFQNMLRSLGMSGGTAPSAQAAPPSPNAPQNRPMLSVPGAQRPLIGAGYAGGSTQNAAAGQLEIMQIELAKMSPDNKDRPGLIREMARLGGAPQQTPQPLIATAQPSGAPRYGMTTDQVIANKVKEETLLGTAKADVQSTQGRQAGVDSAMNAYKLVDQALKHPGLETATGLSGKIDPRNYTPGTDAKNYDSIAKQLQGNAFLSAFASLKGAGQITEVEGAKATAAIARLQQSQSTEEYKSALKDYQSVIKQGLTRMGVDPNKAGDQPATKSSFSQSGYQNEAAAIKDAQNAIMRGASREAVQKRLQSMGLSLPNGAGGSF